MEGEHHNSPATASKRRSVDRDGGRQQAGHRRTAEWQVDGGRREQKGRKERNDEWRERNYNRRGRSDDRRERSDDRRGRSDDRRGRNDDGREGFLFVRR